MAWLFKVLVVLIWLAVAFWSRGNLLGRKLLSYTGSIVALVHVMALAGSLIQNWLVGQQSIEGGVNIVGFIAGCVVGLVLGTLIGSVALRNDLLYWVVQIVAVGLIVFLPLFRW
jgi:ABC-type nitrate/sulfonate/bicarbonate transport system permease component